MSSDMAKLKLMTNDGFGPQLTGKETIVDFFDDKDSILLTVNDQKERIIWEKLDSDLKEKLQSFKTKINRDTPEHKFNILMMWLEQRTVESVIKQQPRSKYMERLFYRNRELEEEQGVRGVLAPGSVVAKSSLFGQDPFGDEPRLPSQCYTKPASTTGAASATATLSTVAQRLRSSGPPSSDQEDGDQETGEDGEGEEYTKVGLLLRDLQESCRDTIRVLIYSLLSEHMATACRKREAKYRLTPALLRGTPRGCMPWKEYKQIIVSRLNKAVGWNELSIMCTTERKDFQPAVAWVQTISRGKEIITKFGHTISDAAYIKKATDYMLNTEKELLEKAIYERKRATIAGYTLERAQTDLLKQTWQAFTILVELALVNFHRQYRKPKNSERQPGKGTNKKRKRTDQVKKREEDKKKKREASKKENKHCQKCHALGLKAQAKTHNTSECKREVREAAHKKKQAREAKQKALKSKTTSEGKKGDVECSHCKKAGRKNINHKPSDCLYETVWKGKTGQALKDAQQEYYRKRKTGTAHIATVVQECMDEESSSDAEPFDWSDNDSQHVPVCWMIKSETNNESGDETTEVEESEGEASAVLPYYGKPNHGPELTVPASESSAEASQLPASPDYFDMEASQRPSSTETPGTDDATQLSPSPETPVQDMVDEYNTTLRKLNEECVKFEWRAPLDRDVMTIEELRKFNQPVVPKPETLTPKTPKPTVRTSKEPKTVEVLIAEYNQMVKNRNKRHGIDRTPSYQLATTIKDMEHQYEMGWTDPDIDEALKTAGNRAFHDANGAKPRSPDSPSPPSQWPGERPQDEDYSEATQRTNAGSPTAGDTCENGGEKALVNMQVPLRTYVKNKNRASAFNTPTSATKRKPKLEGPKLSTPATSSFQHGRPYALDNASSDDIPDLLVPSDDEGGHESTRHRPVGKMPLERSQY